MERIDIKGCIYSSMDMLIFEDMKDIEVENKYYIKVIMTYDDCREEYIEYYEKNNIPEKIEKIFSYLQENSFIKEENSYGTYEFIGPNFKKIDNRQVNLMCFEEYPIGKIFMNTENSKETNMKNYYNYILDSILKSI